MVIAAIGTVLAAGYLLWMFQRVAFGKPEGGVRGRAHPRRPRARVDRVDAAARCCIVVLGIYPDLIFTITDGAACTPPRSQADRGADDVNPDFDFHALAPEIVLTGDDRRRA